MLLFFEEWGERSEISVSLDLGLRHLHSAVISLLTPLSTLLSLNSHLLPL